MLILMHTPSSDAEPAFVGSQLDDVYLRYIE